MSPPAFWSHGLALVLPLFCAFVLYLWGPPLFDLDEGAFTAATSEMLRRGDYVTTWLNGEPRFDKPILIYWLQAASVALGGRDEFFFRLPSALAALGWGVALYVFARRYLSLPGAHLALLVFCSSLTIMVIGRAATADALLNLLIALALLDAWRFVDSGRFAPLYRAYVWIGLGLLAKGPVAAVVPFASISLYAFIRGDWPIWKAVAWRPLGWLIALAIAAPWYIAEYRAQGQDFIQGFLFEHNLGRFSDTMESHGGSAFYYIPALLLMFMPFTAWLWHAVRSLSELRSNALVTWCWCWFAFVFLFFSFSGTQLPHYILYGATPMILLMAREGDHPPSVWWAALPAAALLGLWLALPALMTAAASRSEDVYLAAMLQDGLGRLPNSWYLALGAALLGCLSLPLLRLSRLLQLQSIALLHILALVLFVIPTIADIKQGPVREAAAVASFLDEPVLMWRHDMPSFSTYLDQVTAKRAPLPGELVFTRLGKFSEGSLDLYYASGGILLGRYRGEPSP